MADDPRLAIRKAVAAVNMSERNDLPRQDKARLRYLICSTPRSGSTLLADLLTKTGIAGRPMEYFNDVNITAFFERSKRRMDLIEYIKSIQSLRTTRNGIFGVKSHFYQIANALRSANILDPRPFLQSFDRFIVIKRRDKLSQAISWDKALQTGRWSSMHNGVDPSQFPLKFNPEKISGFLHDILRGERDWEDAITRIGRSFHLVEYEELVEEPAAALSKILAYCDISDTYECPTSHYEKQRDDYNANTEREFLNYISDGRIVV